MNLTLVNAALAGLLVLAAVPLLLHLFARSKPPVYEFSSVEFLRRIVRKTMRFKKPQDIILLILRTLAFLLLIGVFLRPLWFAEDKLAGLFQKKNLVVIVDASASMSLVEGSQTRFATACAEASELLGGLTARDAANVIWLDSEPEAVFPDGLAVNLGFLRDQLRRARVSSERGTPDKAVQLALQLLDGAEGTREICILSDFQRAGWEDFHPALPGDIELIRVKIGDAGAANLAVAALRHEPPDPVVGEEMTVYAEVRNYSSESTQTTVFSKAGESLRSQNLSIEPWSSATAIFRHSITAPGVIPVTVSLAEDTFPGDDRRHLVLTARPYLRVGIWSDGSAIGTDTARVWTRAAQSLGWAVPETLDTEQLKNATLEGFDALLLAGWNASLDDLEIPPATKLICLPASGLSSAALSRLFDAAPTGEPQGDYYVETREDSAGPFRLDVAAKNDALFALFRGGEYGDPAGSAGLQRITAGNSGSATGPVSVTPDTEPLLVWSGDGSPALARVSANRYLWTIPIAEKPGNWAGRVEFLPLFAELLLADRGGIRSDGVAAGPQLDFEPGEPVLWTAPDGAALEELTLTGPQESSPSFSATTTQQYLTEALPVPGLFSWKADGEPVGFSAVNFPADAESDLRTLTRPEIEAGAEGVVVRGGNQVRHLRDGLKLWPWLLAGAVAMWFAESLVMWWAARTA